MDWQAHSFLYISPDAVIARRVRAVAKSPDARADSVVKAVASPQGGKRSR